MSVSVRCTETSRGAYASIYTCEGTNSKSIIVRAKKLKTAYEWCIHSEDKKLVTIMMAANRDKLKKYIEEWLSRIEW